MSRTPGAYFTVQPGHPARPCYLLSHVCMFIITKPLPRLKLQWELSSQRASTMRQLAAAERRGHTRGARVVASAVCRVCVRVREASQDSEVPLTVYSTARRARGVIGRRRIYLYTWHTFVYFIKARRATRTHYRLLHGAERPRLVQTQCWCPRDVRR